MIPFTPVYRYRPTKVRDGVGGSTESLGTPITIYGALKVDANEVRLVVNNYADAVKNDIVAVRGD